MNSISQICIAGSRIFVHENVYDVFLSRFTELSKFQTRATGDPFVPGTTMGPLFSQTQFDVGCFPLRSKRNTVLDSRACSE